MADMCAPLCVLQAADNLVVLALNVFRPGLTPIQSETECLKGIIGL